MLGGRDSKIPVDPLFLFTFSALTLRQFLRLVAPYRVTSKGSSSTSSNCCGPNQPREVVSAGARDQPCRSLV